MEMKELITDFEAFCSETGLIDNANTKMRVIQIRLSYTFKGKCSLKNKFTVFSENFTVINDSVEV